MSKIKIVFGGYWLLVLVTLRFPVAANLPPAGNGYWENFASVSSDHRF